MPRGHPAGPLQPWYRPGHCSGAGIASSALLGPFVAELSRAVGSGTGQFAAVLRSGTAAALLVGVSMALLLAPAGAELVELAYSRRAFGPQEVSLVAPLFAAYVAAAAPYLLRDVLSRALYALGDARAPLRATLAGLALRMPLDWLLAFTLELGALGLVASTGIIHTGEASVVPLICPGRFPEAFSRQTSQCLLPCCWQR